MSRRPLLLVAVLTASFPLLVSGQTESDYYAVPKTVPEFWRATQFEIRTGNFERASERIKGLLDLNLTARRCSTFVDKPTPGTRAAWPNSSGCNVLQVACQRETRSGGGSGSELISRLTKAVEAELSNPEHPAICELPGWTAGGSKFRSARVAAERQAVPPLRRHAARSRRTTSIGYSERPSLLAVDTVPGIVPSRRRGHRVAVRPDRRSAKSQ